MQARQRTQSCCRTGTDHTPFLILHVTFTGITYVHNNSLLIVSMVPGFFHTGPLMDCSMHVSHSHQNASNDIFPYAIMPPPCPRHVRVSLSSTAGGRKTCAKVPWAGASGRGAAESAAGAVACARPTDSGLCKRCVKCVVPMLGRRAVSATKHALFCGVMLGWRGCCTKHEESSVPLPDCTEI